MKKITTWTYISSLLFYLFTSSIWIMFWIMMLYSYNSINWYFYLTFEFIIPSILGIMMIIFTSLKIKNIKNQNTNIQLFSKDNSPWNIFILFNYPSFIYVFLRFVFLRFFQMSNSNYNLLFWIFESFFWFGICSVLIIFLLFFWQKKNESKIDFNNKLEINDYLLKKFKKININETIACWMFFAFVALSSLFSQLMFISGPSLRYWDIIFFRMINFVFPLILGLWPTFFSIRKFIFCIKNKSKAFRNWLSMVSSVWIIFCVLFLFLYFAFPLHNFNQNYVALFWFMNLKYVLPLIGGLLSLHSYQKIKEVYFKFEQIWDLENK